MTIAHSVCVCAWKKLPLALLNWFDHLSRRMMLQLRRAPNSECLKVRTGETF